LERSRVAIVNTGINHVILTNSDAVPRTKIGLVEEVKHILNGTRGTPGCGHGSNIATLVADVLDGVTIFHGRRTAVSRSLRGNV
jgi:hypothetical protein